MMIEPSEIQIEEFLKVTLTRTQNRAAERKAKIEAEAATKPQSIPCDFHRDVMLPIDIELSGLSTASNGGQVKIEYAKCHLCAQERLLNREAKWLHECGVPRELLAATIENWNPRDESESGYQSTARNFANAGRGTLALLGNVGTGKSHIAVGIMRQFKRPYFVKQGTLLRLLRKSYGQNSQPDPIERCQRCDLFVLDELGGPSAGGKDEFPMLHEILDFRHGELLPTVITSNCDWTTVKQILGARLADRLKQSTDKVLLFAGESNRSNYRDEYFGDTTRKPYRDD
jgi:DNA replication protein DnaC